MTCHHQEGLMSIKGLVFCTCGPEFHLIGPFEYTSKFNTEFQGSFMSLRMIFLSFILSTTCGRAASGEDMQVEFIFSK